MRITTRPDQALPWRLWRLRSQCALRRLVIRPAVSACAETGPTRCRSCLGNEDTGWGVAWGDAGVGVTAFARPGTTASSARPGPGSAALSPRYLRVTAALAATPNLSLMSVDPLPPPSGADHDRARADPQREAVPVGLPTPKLHPTNDHNTRLVPRARHHRALRKQVSAGRWRAIARRLRRTAQHRPPPHPFSRRRETPLHEPMLVRARRRLPPTKEQT